MSNALIEESHVKRPATWKYLVGAVVTFPFLFVLWMLFDIWALRPDLLNIDMGTTMNKLRWLSVPLLLVIASFVFLATRCRCVRSVAPSPCRAESSNSARAQSARLSRSRR